MIGGVDGNIRVLVCPEELGLLKEACLDRGRSADRD